MMQWWFAGSSDYQPREHRHSVLLTLAKERALLFSTMYAVVDLRHISLTAPITDCLYTTVHTTRMLESDAKV